MGDLQFVRIENAGTGIREKIREKIFDQVFTTKGRAGEQAGNF